MKNILLLLHEDSGQEARLQVALDLCRAIGGHITCLDVTYVPPILATGADHGDVYAMAELMIRAAPGAAERKQRLETRLGGEDVAWDRIEAVGDIATCLKKASDLSDVIVVSRRLGDFSYPDMRRDAATLIVRSGKPVLAVPPDCRRLDLDRAMIAWDGSPAAACALRAAVPLLQRTREIVLVEVADGSVAGPAEDAARYLSRHDVHATIRRVPARLGDTGTTILGQAASGEFGYAVMGGYGHLRVLEALFGGVTRMMLTDSPIPLFLAH